MERGLKRYDLLIYRDNRMLKIWIIFLIASFSSVSLFADEGTTKQSPKAAEKVSVSLEYKEISSGNTGIRIFVKEKWPWVPEYFVIVNENPDKNGLSLLDDSENRFRVLGSDKQILAGREFNVRFGHYNLVHLKGGGYLDLINKSKFSAPICGIERQYKSINGDNPLMIDFINVVSCGQLNLETSNQKFIVEFWERVKSFDHELSKAFDVIN
jgi:hypothetical protein